MSSANQLSRLKMAKAEDKHVETRFAELPTVESSRQRLAYKPRAYPLKRVDYQSIDIPPHWCRYQWVSSLTTFFLHFWRKGEISQHRLRDFQFLVLLFWHYHSSKGN
jgi:hypothetical protein